MQNYLESLNPRQREAVTATEGPLLIIAGAGTGKTKTLVYRIFHLIHQGVDPRAILGVTFTNKAAKEMVHRIAKLVEEQGDVGAGTLPLLCTFHALGVYLLRRYAEKIGFKKSFTVLDRSDSLALIKRAMNERAIDVKEWEPRRILGVISRAKSVGQRADNFQGNVHSSLTAMSQEAWTVYERLKREENSFDFDDLLLYTHQLLQDHEDVRAQCQHQWKYIHVDEYQDTNKIQYDIIRLLVHAEKNNICVVGDSDQTIYTWRGASMRNIMQFEKDFPGAQAVVLDINYRSTVTILDAAQAIIEKNEIRHKKVLQSAGAQGDLIIGYQALNENDEAHFVIKKIQELVRVDRVECSDIAVLFRANFQSRIFEEVFLHAEIPYHVAGVRFFERKEVKDVLSYLRVALNRESLSDCARAMEYPRRGIGKVAMTKVFSGLAHELSGKAKTAYTQFTILLDAIKEYAENHLPSETMQYIIKQSGIEQELKNGTSEDAERLENVRELVSYATRYDIIHVEEGGQEKYATQLESMLENIALMSDQDTLGEDGGAQSSVKLMTVHAAKGLEFEHVFIVGLEQGLFPSDREDIDNERDHEEERRLMYVAVTRAKKQLYVSYTQMRRVYGQISFQEPSEFLHDIPNDLLLWESSTGLFGGDDEKVKTVYLDF